MRKQCGYSEEEEAGEEKEEAEEAEEDCWGYRGVQRGTMYPYSLLSPKEEGKWIKIYV